MRFSIKINSITSPVSQTKALTCEKPRNSFKTQTKSMYLKLGKPEDCTYISPCSIELKMC